jgi:hypothetical protein
MFSLESSRSFRKICYKFVIYTTTCLLSFIYKISMTAANRGKVKKVICILVCFWWNSVLLTTTQHINNIKLASQLPVGVVDTHTQVNVLAVVWHAHSCCFLTGLMKLLSSSVSKPFYSSPVIRGRHYGRFCLHTHGALGLLSFVV